MQIHQVKSRSANSYVIEENHRLMVIDVALMGDKKVIGYLTNTMKRDVKEVDLVLCTHGHTDHMGGLRKLARQCRSGIGIPSFTSLWKERLTQMLLWPLPGYWLDRLSSSLQFEKNPISSTRSDLNQPDPSITRLHPGASLPGFDNWRVIHTPGHTQDSCCYFHPPSRSLISGDTILASGKTNELLLPSIYNSRNQLENSIAELRDLKATSIYPGHGSVLSGSNLLDDIAGIR